MKKNLALLLALVLLVGLVACGTADTAAEETVEAAVETSVYHGELPLVQPGKDNKLTIGIVVNGLVEDYDDNAYTKWLEEQTGVDLEFVLFTGNSSDAATQISLMMASGEKLPDILYYFTGISKTAGEEFGREGYFADLSEYYGVYDYYTRAAFDEIFANQPKLYNQMLERASSANGGSIYCFPVIGEAPLDTPACHAWINREWLDTLGLDMPTDPQELHDVLVAFRDQDPNGNGIKDEIPMIACAEKSYQDIVSFIINSFIYYNHSNHFTVENGRITTPYLSDEYRQALIYIHSLVEEGLLSTLTWTQSNAEMKSLINPVDGEPFLCGVVTGHADISWEFGNHSIFAYEPLAPLADAGYGKGGYGPLDGVTMRYITYVTEDCENKLLAFKFLDFTAGVESGLRQRWGEYGVDWEWSKGGVTGNTGEEAKLKLLKPTTFSEQNAQMWHVCYGIASEWYHNYEADFSNAEDWDTNRAAKLLKNYQQYQAVGQPEEVFYFTTYSVEEAEEREEITSDLFSFLKTSRAEFCNGVQDPADDAAWQAYVDGAKALHYDRWLEITQAAWDRMEH